MFEFEFDQPLFEFEQATPQFEPLFALPPQRSTTPPPPTAIGCRFIMGPKCVNVR